MGKTYLNIVLHNFLAIEKNKILFEEYKINRDKNIMELLEKEFKIFYSKIVLVTYFSKSLYYAAQKYDQKIRRYQSFKEELLEQNEDSFFYAENINVTDSDNIANYVADKSIFKAINKLTDRQKQILYLLHIKEMTEIEAASIMNISQQAVNKGKNKAIKEIQSGLNANAIK
ncbi:sigma-70 family RNA polymerase sigma factor [Lysinibacillus xylanilyticus]|uniref:sigma-70 family RNA polymerase sigma factor n=1 Tax=Lysinibacillus xylanilyticus TaxID=582475 RepID=UPI00083CA112|nr:sigma-70 family RNA polymerase sigma factor [Lysinibacillus xylanilyticus]